MQQKAKDIVDIKLFVDVYVIKEQEKYNSKKNN
jgi:hypothetical protein